VSDTPRTDEFFYERARRPGVYAWLKYARTIERELTDSNAELRRLHAVNAELLERLKVVAWTLNLVHPYGVPDVLHEGSAFRKSIIAAIAKAEGVKP
jgi:hypothetical protein